MQFIDLKTQYRRIEKAIKSGIEGVLEHGQYILGPEVKALEQALSDYVGGSHVVACASGTDALYLALMAIDIQPGDEVITTPFSFFATAEVIMLLGAKPVFVDIDPLTYNIDPGKIEAAISDRTKAIMPVSLYGQCAEMDVINIIAQKHDLVVIEDAAQSFGATHKGLHSCNLSDIGCTSFFPSKPLGGYGDSGACFIKDEALAEKLRSHSVHGQTERYFHPYLGVNGRMDSIQAAVLIEKLKIFADEVNLRQAVAAYYQKGLAGLVKTPFIAGHNSSVFAQYTIEVDNRDQLSARLTEQGVPIAVHYPVPLHFQPALASLGYQAGDFPVAEEKAKKVMSLPMSPYTSKADQDQVITAIKKALDALQVSKQTLTDEVLA